jgi:DNA uptake protein ComE-like DNA-binding protein
MMIRDTIAADLHADREHYRPRCVDLNTAPEELLAGLFTLGPARIQALVQHRPFRDWAEVERVPGISQSIVESLKNSGARLS